jgi:argininosuccinate lyase
MHSFVERELIARIGDAGRRLHTGRSRNEQVSVDFRLYLRRRIPGVQRALAGLVEALAHQAERAGQAVMPSYTHLRRAQPVLVAHSWLSHAAAVRRDVERLDAARPSRRHAARIAPSPVRVRRGRALARHAAGFSRVVANSIDAAGDRDCRGVSVRVLDGDGAPQPPRRGRHSGPGGSSVFEIHDSVATGST